MNDTTKRVLFDICKNKQDLLLVDVMNHIHRFLWVNQDLSITLPNGDIQQTGHIYGFTNYLLLLKDRFPNCAIVLCLDGHDEERKRVNPEYKAGRTHHESLYQIIPDILDICSLVEGVYTCYDALHEADDAIGVVCNTVKKLCANNGIKKNIYTFKISLVAKL